jgi:DNA-binding NarL/FixJ family response regulator
VIRVFLIAASPLARAALQNRLNAQSAKIVGTAATIDALGSELSDTQADVLLVDAAGESPEAIIASLVDSDLAAEIPIVVLRAHLARSVNPSSAHRDSRAPPK